VLLMIMYAYTILGMEAFRGALDRYGGGKNLAGFTGCSPYCPSYDTAGTTLLTLFQILVGSNFSPLLFETIQAQRSIVGPLLFYISFIMLGHVFMLSLLAALVLEVYSVEMERAMRQDNESHMQTLCNAATASSHGEESLWDSQWSSSSALPTGPTVRRQASQIHTHSQIVLTDGVRATFNRFDADHSGTIADSELSKLLMDLGFGAPTGEEVERAMRELDGDGTGDISYDEFLPWWRHKGITRIFRLYDQDGTGTIDVHELPQLMMGLGVRLSDDELTQAHADLDSNGDGTVSLQEYMAWFDSYDCRMQFHKYDADDNGTVNRKEFGKIAQELGMPLSRREIDQVFDRLDVNRSRAIDFFEFYRWWLRVKTNTKEAILQVARDGNWEETVFLEKHDMAERRVLQELRGKVEGLADSLEAGEVPTRAELLKMLCRVERDLDDVPAAVDAASPSVGAAQRGSSGPRAAGEEDGAAPAASLHASMLGDPDAVQPLRAGEELRVQPVTSGAESTTAEDGGTRTRDVHPCAHPTQCS